MSQVKSAKVVNFARFFLKCVNADNTNAICYEGLHAATGLGLEESIFETKCANAWIINLYCSHFQCVSWQRQGSQRSVSVVRSPSRRPPVGSRFSYGRVVQWLLSTFHALWLNTNDEAFKFPDDDVIMHPKCLHGENCRNFYLGVDGSCENCKLYWICVNVFQML
uniref:Uncharacterized protein n=1 Tax=Brassica oleracea TaxID=3712 RepID=A0A3P6GIT3_BRAOL|nr:unnamed protein product [Brassica oleracea]